jgi:hypothetical protein
MGLLDLREVETAPLALRRQAGAALAGELVGERRLVARGVTRMCGQSSQ